MKIILTYLGLKRGHVLMRIMAYIIHTGIHGVFAQEFMALFFHGGPTRDASTCEPAMKSLIFSILYWIGIS